MSAPHDLSPEAYRAYRATQEAGSLTEAAIATGELIDALKADLAAAREELADAVMARDFAIAGTEGLQGLLRQAQAREARLREALGNCLSLVELKFGNTDPTGNAAIAQAKSALAERGDNPVWDVVEAAREWGNALNNKYDSRDAQGKLYDAPSPPRR